MKAIRPTLLAVVFAGEMNPAALLAVTPTQAKFIFCRQRRAAHFGGHPATNAASLAIAFEDVRRGVTRDRSGRGTPFQLGDRTLAHGLAFNAIKHLRARLGQPGGRFTAVIGQENNDDTRRDGRQHRHDDR